MAPKPRLETFGGKGPLIKIHYLFFAALALLIAGLTIYLNTQLTESAAKNEAHRMLERALDRLEEEKHQARAYAVLLAKNPALTAALSSDDRTLAVKTVASLHDRAANDPILSQLRFQVHTADLRVFARSWDLASYGQSLEGFRKGVMLAKERRVPTVSVEPGRLLNIKAVAPVFDKERYAGSVEVIAGFGRMGEALDKEGIDLAVWMDEALLDTAVDMADFPKTGGYVLAAPGAPELFAAAPDAGDLAVLKQEGFLRKQNALYAAAPLFDYDGRFIALIVASRPLSKVARNRPVSLDFFLDRHDRDLPAPPPVSVGPSGYDALSLAALIERRSNVPAHERALFNRALMDKAAAQGNEALLRALLLEEHNKTRSVRIQ